MALVGSIVGLARMWREGGMEIRTLAPAATSGQGEPRLLARTVIQPDGDVITWVAPELVSVKEGSVLEGCWHSHIEQAQRNLQNLRSVRLALRWLWTPFLTPLAWQGLQWDFSEALRSGLTLLPWLLLPLVVRFATPYLLRQLASARAW